MTTTILTDLSTPALIGAIEDNITALNDSLTAAPGAEQGTDEDVRWIITGAPFSLFNAVSQARFTAADADARIAATLAPFAARGAPMTWYTGPSTRPSDLGERLLAHGLVYSGDDPGMALDLRT